MTNEAVLVIDDDEFVQFFVERALQHLGFTVECAPCCEQGLDRYADRAAAGAPFRAVITDISIPGGMDGTEFVTRLHARYPDAAVFVSSGDPDAPCMQTPEAFGFIGAIHKPVTLESLSGDFLPRLRGTAAP